MAKFTRRTVFAVPIIASILPKIGIAAQPDQLLEPKYPLFVDALHFPLHALRMTQENGR